MTEGKKTTDMDEDATNEYNMATQASPSLELPADLAKLPSVRPRTTNGLPLEKSTGTNFGILGTG